MIILQVIAQSLREAVLETSVYANLDITNKQAMYESGTGSEKSFPPDSDPDGRQGSLVLRYKLRVL